MSDETPAASVEIEGQDIKVVLSPETEAHATCKIKAPAETEAHGFSVSPADPALDAYARIRLSFPADAAEQTLELRYRPGQDGGEPEVELHRRHLR